FRGYHSLETDRCEQRGFHDLRFGDRRRDTQKRLARKTNRPFRQRPNIAGEPKCRQRIEKIRTNSGEGGMPAKVSNVLGAEADSFQKVQSLLQTGCNEEVSLGREVADEKLESCPGLEVRFEVPRRHRQFI